MPGPHPAVAATRLAVRRALADTGAASAVAVACSGGRDSLALAAATAFETPHATALVVDHGLQEGSADIAARAAQTCADLGLSVQVLPVRVAPAGEGIEAAARTARYAALTDAALAAGCATVLLGHTLDDQAESVLLGLARGSGPRALAGMAPQTQRDGVRWLRPFLTITREDTTAACAALGLQPWDDPHNADPRYLRVRARAALSDLDRDLGPGIRAGLARSAQLIRQDLALLDEQAAAAAAQLGDPPWSCAVLADLPGPLRSRVWRAGLVRAGARSASLSKAHLDAVDALIVNWHGQGPIDVPGVQVLRRGGRIHLGPRGANGPVQE